MSLRCLIVDDEPIACDILENYIKKVDTLQFIAKCNNAYDALNILHKEQIDVLFLDIKMPSLSGLEMLRTIDNKPITILTTAFSEFGAESYEYGVSDYLLKPISFERFMKSINKIVNPRKVEFPSIAIQLENEKTNLIFFKADKKIYKFNYSDLMFFQGNGNYVKVYSENQKPIMILDKLSDLSNKLPSDIFLRIHKSYIINIRHINKLAGNRIFIENQEIPVGQTFKEELLRKMKTQTA